MNINVTDLIDSEGQVEKPKKTLSQIIRGDRHLSLIQFILSKALEMSDVDPDSDEVVVVTVPVSKEMLESICSHRAEGCLWSLLDTTWGWKVNVAVEGELYPLHIAAQSLWFYGTELILQKLESNHMVMPCNDPEKPPLAFALNSIRDNTCASEWNSKISIFKLIYIFCLPQMKEPLETVKLLASKTDQLEAISSRCVMQGEVVQLAALLLVAWDKLVEPFSDQGIKGCPIGQLILSELQHYQEGCISQSSNTSPEFHEYGANLENAWKVLELLDIARNTIEECQRSIVAAGLQPYIVPFNVSTELLRLHKLYLGPEDIFADDVKCLRPGITPKQKAWLFRNLDKKIRSVTPPLTLAERRTDEKFLRLYNLRRSAESVGSMHSFHTLAPNVNLVKPVTSEPHQAYQKPGTRFFGFLRSQSITSNMSRLFSTLKRM